MTRAAVGLLLLGLANIVRGQAVGEPVVRVIVLEIRAQESFSVLYKAENAGAEDVLLLSPESLSRVYDREHCSLALSGEVKRRPSDYSFEPKLEPLARASTRDFRVTFKRSELPGSTCAEWVVSATVSYLTATDGAGLRLGTEQDSKRYAADRERIAHSEPSRFSLGR